MVCFKSLFFMEHFLLAFPMLCKDSESLAARPSFDPALGQGCRSAYVERKDLNSKEVTGQICNILAEICREILCTGCLSIPVPNVFFPKH